jgi:hypothetical protein
MKVVLQCNNLKWGLPSASRYYFKKIEVFTLQKCLKAALITRKEGTGNSSEAGYRVTWDMEIFSVLTILGSGKNSFKRAYFYLTKGP